MFFTVKRNKNFNFVLLSSSSLWYLNLDNENGSQLYKELFYFDALIRYRYKFYSSILFVIRVEGIEDPRGIGIPGWCSISEVTLDRERIIIGTHTLFES